MNQIVPVPRKPAAPPEILRARQVSPARPRPLRARRRKQTNVKLWLPVTPLVIALSPFAVLALPFVAAADAARHTKVAAGLVNATRLLLPRGGAEISLPSRKAHVHIRLF